MFSDIPDLLESSDDLENIQNPEQMLTHLFKTYVAFHNITFLEGIFLSAKAPKLYDRCIEFCKKKKEEGDLHISRKEYQAKVHLFKKMIYHYAKYVTQIKNMLVILKISSFSDHVLSGIL